MKIRLLSKIGTVYWLFGALAVCCALAQMWYFSRFVVDDAYISFRYAENFIHGNGLVFNPGEYVEGYTNFLWVVLLGLLNRLGLEMETAARVLGGMTSLLTLWGTFWLSQEIRESSCTSNSVFSHSLSMAAVLYVATAPAFGIWSVAGLETPLFACILIAAVNRHVREETRGLFPLSALLFAVAALVRPEGVLYFGLTMVSAGIFRLRKQRQSFLGLWKPIVLFLPFVSAHIIWRWSYYGSLVPNTFYMKAGDGFQLSGIKYIYDFFLAYGGTPIFICCVLLLLLYRYQAYWVQYVLLLLSISLCYFVYVGGDWMPGFRFFVPLLPLFFLCLQAGFDVLYRQFSGPRRRLMTTGVAVLVLAVLANNLYQLYVTPRIDTRLDGHVIIGHWLRQHAEPDDVLAAIDIGAMAYLSGLWTIDYFGLADAHIARLKPQMYEFEPGFWGHQTVRVKSDTDYVLSQTPRFIELNTRNSPTSTEQTIPADPYSALMFRNTQFRDNYHPVYHAGGSTIFQRYEGSDSQ